MELLARPPGGGSGHGDADGGGTRDGDTRGRGGAWAAERAVAAVLAATGSGGWGRRPAATLLAAACGGGAAVAARRRRCSALPQQARPDSTGSLPARPAHFRMRPPRRQTVGWPQSRTWVKSCGAETSSFAVAGPSITGAVAVDPRPWAAAGLQPSSPLNPSDPSHLVAGTLGSSAPFFFCAPSRRPFRPLSSPPATKILPLSDRPSEPTRRPSPLAYHPSSGGRRALLDPTTPPASPSPPDPSPRWTAPPSQRASPMGPCGALPTPIRRGPLQPCGLASPPVGGVEVGGLEDGPLSLREGGGVEGGGVEGWLSPLALSI